MTPQLTETQDALRSVAARVGPAVVGLGRGYGSGSGVVIAPGRVLTNAHNLRGSDVTVLFEDGRSAGARVAGRDDDYDLAVLDVDTVDVAPVAWEPDAVDADLGAAVIALANPGGRGLRVTTGFVSSAAHSFRGPRGRRVTGAIEHTAPLPRGSSGGPLVDLEGRLLGLSALRLDGGLILAVPANAAARQRVELLGRGDSTARPRLGVGLAPPRVARKLRAAVGLPPRDGLLVRTVEDGGAAHQAGVERGDLVVAAAGAATDRLDVLYDALDATGPGGTLALTILRGTDERTVEVQL